MVRVLALVAPALVVGSWGSAAVGTADASGTTADLCLSTGVDSDPEDPDVGRGGCRYSSRDVPLLDVDVCWDAGAATIKLGPTCEGRARTYHVTFGELIDPLTGEVEAYAPLEDTCAVVPCEPMDDGLGPMGDGVACCDPYTGNCSPTNSEGECPVGEWTWCKHVEVVDENTVICHD